MVWGLDLLVFVLGCGLGWWARAQWQVKGMPRISEANAQPLDAIQQRAQVLVAEVEPLAMSGEYKRHLVYAQLIKEFPTTPKRVLGKAIEASLA
jgi:hypothetical protein